MISMFLTASSAVVGNGAPSTTASRNATSWWK
jgi:hypothetical protein